MAGAEGADTAASHRPRAAVVYHPVRAPHERLRRAVAAAERRAGWSEALWLPTEGPGAQHGIVSRAVEAGARVVIAAGGDGTVSGVAAALRPYPVPLGILPVGTANLYARNLGLPLLDLGAAARIALSGVERRSDLGTIDYRLDDGTEASRSFTVIGGFGIDADMVAGTDPALKRRLGWIAYVGPILRALRRTQGEPITYAIDGGDPVDARLHTVFVGNCGTVTAGLRLLPEASIDDGLLDVLAIRSIASSDRRRLVRWLAAHNRAFPPRRGARRRRAETGSRTLRYLHARVVELRLGEGLTVQADGDELGTVVWARFGIEPGIIAVRVAENARAPS